MVFTKTCLFIILNGIWEVWGCPGGWHGPYEEIVSNFGRVWSYRTWGKSSFIYFFEILETHFITKYLQIGPRASRLVLGFLLKARVPSQELSNKCIVQKMTWRKTIFSGKLDNLPKSSVFVRMASFFMPCFWPHGARGHKGQMQRIPKTN